MTDVSIKGGKPSLDKKSEEGFSIYIPLVLITAFLLGTLSISLISVRENVIRMTDNGSISDSDHSGKQNTVRKSRVYENNGLSYRIVSASDLGIESDDHSETKLASAVPASSDPDGSETKLASAVPASSDPDAFEKETGAVQSQTTSDRDKGEDSAEKEDDAERGLKLPYDHYINFVPAKKGYKAYLTFDDGPSENTGAILDILDYYNVKATFFVIYHEDMEEQYKAIVSAGHAIALHSYTHDYSKVYSGEKAFFDEMEGISDYIYSETGVRTKLMRFPGGSSNTISWKYCKGLMSVLKKRVKEKGYVYQDWNVDSCDAEKSNTPPKRLLANIRSSLKEQKTAVVLMHDAGESTRTTVEALPEIIELFYAKGYTLGKMDMTTEEIHHNW